MAKQTIDKNGLTVGQVAKAFGVATITVNDWRIHKRARYTGKLPVKVIKVGKMRRVFYPVAGVKAWAKKNGLVAKI